MKKKDRKKWKALQKQISGLGDLLSAVSVSGASADSESENLAASLDRQDRMMEEMRAFLEEYRESLRDVPGKSGSGLTEVLTRQTRTMEDALDALNELQDSLQKSSGRLENAARDQARAEAEKARAREERMLQLQMALEDQLFILRRAADNAGDETWSRQLTLAEESVLSARQQAEFRILEETGVPLNYEQHETVSVLPTEDRDRNLRVAEVVARGYLYRNRVVRKAKVTVYQYRENS